MAGPGNRDPLALGNNGASSFQNDVEYGYSGSISVDDGVATETGQMMGPTQTSINCRISLRAPEYPTRISVFQETSHLVKSAESPDGRDFDVVRVMWRSIGGG